MISFEMASSDTLVGLSDSEDIEQRQRGAVDYRAAVVDQVLQEHSVVCQDCSSVLTHRLTEGVHTAWGVGDSDRMMVTEKGDGDRKGSEQVKRELSAFTVLLQLHH